MFDPLKRGAVPVENIETQNTAFDPLKRGAALVEPSEQISSPAPEDKGFIDKAVGLAKDAVGFAAGAPGYLAEGAVGIASHPIYSYESIKSGAQSGAGDALQGMGRLSRLARKKALARYEEVLADPEVKEKLAKGESVFSPLLLQTIKPDDGKQEFWSRLKELRADNAAGNFDRINDVEALGLSVKQAASERQENVPDSFKESAAGQITSGLGSTIPIVASGPLGRVGQLAVSGLMMGNNQADDYLTTRKDNKKSVDATDELFSFLGGAATAPLDMIPIERILKRADKVSGGAVNKAIKQKLRQRVGEYTKDVGLSALEEAFGEGAQAIASNVLAKDIIGYDEARGYLDDVSEQVYAGMGAGAMLSAVASSKKLKAQKQQLGATKLKNPSDRKSRIDESGNAVDYGLDPQSQNNDAASTNPSSNDNGSPSMDDQLSAINEMQGQPESQPINSNETGPIDVTGTAIPNPNKGIDSVIDAAEKLGFHDEVARLVTAKRLYGDAVAARERGDLQAAQRYMENANTLYDGVTGKSESLKAVADNYPTPYSHEGQVTGGQADVEPAPSAVVTDSQLPSAATSTDQAPTNTPIEQAKPASDAGIVLQNRDRSTQASIGQMQSIAKSPDYGRLAFSRDIANGAPIVLQDPSIAVTGKADYAVDNNGKRYPLQYAVVESDSLLASNNADGTSNKDYINGVSGRPRAVAGNGRVAGLQGAYSKGTAKNYRQELAADADLYGIDKAAIEAMNKPVLVRVMPSNNIPKNIGDLTNTSGVSELSPKEQALNDIRRVDINSIQFGDDGQITDSSVRQFIAVMPQSEQSGLLDGNRPNRQAYERLSSAAFAKAYDSEALVQLQSQATEVDARNILNALLSASVNMSKLSGHGKYDVRGLITEAAEAAVNATRKGQKLDQYLLQVDLAASPEIVPLLKMFAENIRSSKRIAEKLNELAEALYTEATKPDTDMFGAVEKRSAKTIQDEVLGDGIIEGGASDLRQRGRAAINDGHDERQEAVSRGRGSSGEAEAIADRGKPAGRQEVTQEVTQKTPAKVGVSAFKDYKKTDGSLFISEMQAKAARNRADLKGKALQPTKVDGGWMLREIQAEKKPNSEANKPNLESSEPILADYTEEDIAKRERDEKEAKQTKAKEDAAAEQKRKANSEALDFRLSGSDSDADIAAAGGQESLLASVETNPTEAQKEAGNYKKAHIIFQGLNLSIENPKGSTRSGVDENGKAWESEMGSHYGYIKKTTGADGDHVDVFVGEAKESDLVFVIDQVNSDGSFDEHKVMLGFKNQKQAVDSYKGNYQKDWTVGPVKKMTMAEFKGWLENGDTTKPAKQVEVKSEKQVRKESNKPVEDFGDESLDLTRPIDKMKSIEKDINDDDIASQPLSKTWPKKEVDDIEDKAMAAFATVFREQIPSKPSKSYKLTRWVEMVKTARSFVRTYAEDGKQVMNKLKMVNGLEGIYNRIVVLGDIDRADWPRVTSVEIYGGAFKYNEDGTKTPSPFAYVIIDGKKVKIDGANKVSDVIDTVKEKLAESNKPDSSKKMKFTVRGRVGSYYIHKDGDTEYRKLKTFTDSKEALDYVKNNNSDLVSEWEKVKERDNVHKADVRTSENRERKSIDHRKGKDVTTEEFHEAFGLRHVAWGKWVSDTTGERQDILNRAYDGFMDMADIVGIPPKAIGLNGDLIVTFGKRGTGNAAAHFEAGQTIINLTKTSGAGSLAHEWFHALDNYFQKQRSASPTKQGSYITYKPEAHYIHKDGVQRISADKFESFMESKNKGTANASGIHVRNPEDWKKVEGVRPEVEQAFANLVEKLNASPMRKRAWDIDSGKKDGYWSRVIERAARSFENYVIAKMADSDNHNDFLANVTKIEDFKRNPERYPYLLDSEMAPVAEAFDNLFDVIESKETDKGTALYSYAEEDADAIKDALNEIPEIIRPIVAKNDLLLGWTLLAQNDDAFQLPITSAKSVPEMIRQQFGKDTKIQYDADAAASAKGASSSWAITIPVTRERKSSTATFHVYQNKDTVWIDVSEFPEGGKGKQVYNAVANYAYNTGKVFIGDPDGLSKVAQSRRLENMITSALKFGTTDHLWPHEEQFNARAGVPAIKWKDGDFSGNLENMIRASYELVASQFPEIANLRYDGKTDQFIDGENGKVWNESDFDDLAKQAREPSSSFHRQLNARRSGGNTAPITAGSKTLERAVFTHTLLRGTSSERGRQILVKLGAFGSQRLKEILYSKNKASQDNKAQQKAGLSVSELEQTLRRKLGKNIAASIKVLKSRNDVPQKEGLESLSVWHGTPHKGIEKEGFKLNKIGSGEGNQAYGWGIYFAGNKDVAEGYRKNLSYDEKVRKFLDALPEDASIEETLEAIKNDEIPQDVASVIKALADDDWLGFDYPSQAISAAFKNLDNYDASPELRKAINEHNGQLYQSNITNDAVLIDYDKPINKQPANVQDIIQKELEEYRISLGASSKFIEMEIRSAGDFYKRLAGKYSPKGASERLLAAGIQGIRYLDGNSRASGSGDHNYVIWDESLLAPEISGIQPMYSKESDRVEGMYDPETSDVYLFADSISSPERATWVAYHELWHRGIRAIDGKKEKYTGGEEGQALRQALNSAGLNKTVRQLADAILKDRKMPESQRRLATEEALAELNAADETGNFEALKERYGVNAPNAMLPGIRGHIARFIDAVKAVFRKIGIGKDTATDSEVMDIIRGARKGYTQTSMNGSGDALYSQSPDTKAAYEKRIDELFAGDKAKQQGVKILDRSDVLDLLGYGDMPVMLNEPHGFDDGRYNHPLTKDQWLKIPEWLENPVAVFKRDDGHLTIIAPELVDGKPIVIGISPNAAPTGGRSGESRHLMLTAYVKDKGNLPVGRMIADGNLLYVDARKSPEFNAGSKLQLPSSGANVRGLGYKIHTGADLFKYRQSNEPLYSIAPDEKASPESNKTPPEETRFREKQRRYQDRFNRFTVVQEWLKEQGIKLSNAADVYRAEERMYGKIATRMEDFREKELKPLIKKVSNAGYSMSQIEELLHAQHAQERNAQVAKKNDMLPDGGSGMTNAEAKAILAKHDGDEAIKNLAKEFRNITESTKAILLDAGIINQEVADAWNGAYKFYIPLKGGPESSFSTATGRGLTPSAKLKRALGHRPREDGEWIIENILADHERAIMLAEKNVVARHLMQMAIEVNDPNLITIDKPEKRGVLKTKKVFAVWHKGGVVNSFDSVANARKYIDDILSLRGNKLTREDFSIDETSEPNVVYMARPQLADNETVVYLNGHAVRMQINDELLARAWNKLGDESIGSLLKHAQQLNRWLSQVYTGYNPEFLQKNIIRDFMGGLANLTGEEGGKVAVTAVKNYPKAFAQLINYHMKGNESSAIKDYRANGGSTGAAWLSDLERIGDDVSKSYHDAMRLSEIVKTSGKAKAAASAWRRFLKHTVGWMEHLNAAGENAMRLSTYMSMIEAGNTPHEAAHRAKNVTVNFNRKGENTAALGALYLFFNPSVQGTAAIAHAHFKGKHKEQAWAVSAGLISAGLLYALTQAGADDDEWRKLSEYDKERNIMMRTSKGWVKIPIPYGHGWFWSTGVNLADYIKGTNTTMETAIKISTSFIGEFTPFGSVVNGDELDSKNALFFAPTFMQIPGAIAVNKTSMGGEVYPESTWDKGIPDNQKMYRATKGTMFEQITSGLNAGSGGDAVKGGFIDMSPETLKYLWSTFAGGAGNFALSAINFPLLLAQDVAYSDVSVKEIPLLRSMYKEDSIQDARSAFYAATKESQTIKADFERAKRVDRRNQDGNMPMLQKYGFGREEQISVAKAADSFRKLASAKREEQIQTLLNTKKPIGWRRAMVKKLEREEAQIYDDFYEAFLR